MSYGIHDQGIAEFNRRAGEFAQNQDAILVIARRQILLGDQVHAIVQRGDEADVRRPVPARYFFVIALTFDQDNGTPIRASGSAG